MPPLVIKPFDAAYADQIVRLHRAVMGYSVNALLGPAHLAAVYRITATLPGACVRVAVDDTGLLGAVSATLDEEQCASQLLHALSIPEKLRMALHLTARPACWRALAAARRASKPVLVDGQPVRACLTSIIVDPSCQGRGIGRALVGAVDAFMREHGVARYRLDTRDTNAGARAFYTRLGFVEHEQRGSDIIFVRKL